MQVARIPNNNSHSRRTMEERFRKHYVNLTLMLGMAIGVLGCSTFAQDRSGKTTLALRPVSASSTANVSSASDASGDQRVIPVKLELEAQEEMVASPEGGSDRLWTLEALEALALGHNPTLLQAAVVGELETVHADLVWETCLEELQNNSPQMQAAKARVQVARSELARESVEAIPNVSVQVVAERDRVTDSNTVSTLLSIPVPVFNRNQGNIHRAHAEIRQADAEIERVRLVLEDSLMDAFRRYRTARDQVASLQKDILPDAQEAMRITTTGYEQGEFSILEVLTTRQVYFQGSLAHIEALTELHKVTTEVEGLLLTGGLNPPEIGAAIQGGGGGNRQRAALSSLQENTSKRILPAAIQTGR